MIICVRRIKRTIKSRLSNAIIAAIGTAVLTSGGTVFAEQQTLEEIVVSARMRAETLQDVPVTAIAFSEATLDKLNISTVRDVAQLVPGFQTSTRGSGGGGSLYLRGIGSSPTGGAFDSAVALNYDGVVLNNSRLLRNANLDVSQVEVLKGPQSLYFGKSASAGVVSMFSNDPTDEFEAKISAFHEFEEDGTGLEGYIAGPLGDSVGARLAVRTSDLNEVFENAAPNVANPDRGQEFLDSRLTLTWDPTDTFSANFKYAISEYEADGAHFFVDVLCRNPAAPQSTALLGGAILLPSGYDCDYDDGVGFLADGKLADPESFPRANGGVPYETQDVVHSRLKLEWDITDSLALTSITGYYDIDQNAYELFAYDQSGTAHSGFSNTEESWSQEFRLASNFDGRFNFIVGAFYQDRDQNFITNQAATGTLLGLQILDDLGANPFPFVADPVTGYTFEWAKQHPSSAKALSLFTSGTFEITDRLEITAGVRWTDEEKESRFLVPFMHTAFALQGFVPSGFDSGKIKFEDDNISPEVSLLYTLNNDVNLFAAYKTGFKSGGIDNSSLPTPSTTTAFSNGDFSEVLYDSETGAGFEFGVKSRLLEGSLNINATVYRYVFDDLQIQQFDGTAIAFKTFNAGELENYGFEIDGLWLTSLNGLTLRGALAYTKTEYSDTVINQGGADLNGETRQNSPEIAANLGFDYSFELGDSGLEMGIYGTSYYSGSYYTSDSDTDANGNLDRFEQDSFWTVDAGVFMGSIDDKWKVSLTGRNITDEIYFTESVTRPLTNAAEDPLGRGDLGVFANRGRIITLRADFTF